MRTDILRYIRELSLADKKVLSQKVLKLMEEAGELAKEALPFENAHGTTHRFSTPDKILEEVADCMLVALSIGYSLGYADDDIAQEMIRKADYWAELQAREERMTDRTPYEIHVTVAAAENLGSFSQACASLGVKPIVLDLQRHGGAPLKDVMTSSVCYGRNSDAYAEMTRIAAGLTKAGLQVVRQKIETVPWHPAAPTRLNAAPEMPANCYFESHLAVQLPSAEAQQQLRVFAEQHGCHLSRNVFKRHEDGSFTVMMTYRVFQGTYEDVRDAVEAIQKQLGAEGFVVAKSLVEFSLYDSKYSHDAAWLAGAA